jgi:hypothetical protein
MPVSLTLKMGIALLLALSWGSFATFKWITNNATAPIECDNTKLTARISELEAGNKIYADELLAAYELQAQQKPAGREAEERIVRVFVPIKEKVSEISVASCVGVFDQRVRDGLTEAVAAANASR